MCYAICADISKSMGVGIQVYLNWGNIQVTHTIHVTL